MKTFPRDDGFSVVELMVTIAVLAIILGIGMPSFQNMLESSRLDSAAESLADSFRLARSEAIARNATVIASGTYGSGWTVSVNGTTLREYEAFHSGVSGGTTINTSFNGRGIAGSDESYELVYGAKYRCVSIKYSGLVKLDDGACPQP